MKRRAFLEMSVLGGLFGSTGTLLLSGGVRENDKLDRIGLQLYTVRDLMEQDFEGTLERVAAIGYRDVEFAGYFDRSADEIRTILDRVGLKAPATHTPLRSLRSNLNQLFDDCLTLGHEYLVLGFLLPQERASLDDYRRIADLLNKAGEAGRRAGVSLGYHNHDFEFEAIDGVVPYDLLLAECDSRLVHMELDLFWITKAGRDPIAYFEQHSGRFHLCHIKDMDNGGQMVDVGGGQIDFMRILLQRELAGLQHYFVEHDEPANPMNTIENSFRYLDNLAL